MRKCEYNNAKIVRKAMYYPTKGDFIMAETREEAIARIENFWHRLQLLPEEQAREEMKRFQLPTVFTHAEAAELNRAFIKHVTPQQMIEVLKHMLMLLKP